MAGPDAVPAAEPTANSLSGIAREIEWTDADAMLAARNGVEDGYGRLADLAEWLAATQGAWPPPGARRCVLLRVGGDPEPGPALADAAARHDIRLRHIPTVENTDGDDDAVDDGPDARAAFADGVAAVDAAVDEGADLLLVACPVTTPAAAVVVALLTGTEPVALLPRGRVAAGETYDWIERATALRDTLRSVRTLRRQPDDLLTGLTDGALAACAGIAVRSAARRTPLVLDGTCAVAAAALVVDTQPRAGRWWQVADTSADPVHEVGAADLGDRPILEFGTTRGDGTAALACVPLLELAAAAAAAAPPGPAWSAW